MGTSERAHRRAMCASTSPMRCQATTLDEAPNGMPLWVEVIGTPLYMQATAVAHLCSGLTGMRLNAPSMSAFQRPGS